MSSLLWPCSCVLFLAVSVAQEPVSQDPCPSSLATANNTLYLQVHEGTCYLFAVHQRKTFLDANEQCEEHGGTLAMPTDEDTNDFLAKKAFEHYGTIEDVWIGLTDLWEENNFLWLDGSPLSWHRFSKGNGPTNNWLVRQFEDCVALDPLDGFWHDFLCSNDIVSTSFGSQPRKPFICQYQATDIMAYNSEDVIDDDQSLKKIK